MFSIYFFMFGFSSLLKTELRSKSFQAHKFVFNSQSLSFRQILDFTIVEKILKLIILYGNNTSANNSQ